MARYQIWDKQTDIYTKSNKHYTAQEWADKHPWVKIPGAKMVITTGLLNGGTAMEFEQTKGFYQGLGAAITDDMTDEEVLRAIEDFEDNPPAAGPTVEERTAAALEFLAIASLPDET